MRVRDSIADAHAGEWGLALENLIDNMSDYGIRVTDAGRAALSSFVESFGLDATYASIVEMLNAAA